LAGGKAGDAHLIITQAGIDRVPGGVGGIAPQPDVYSARHKLNF
jgi:hypothetical protein